MEEELEWVDRLEADEGEDDLDLDLDVDWLAFDDPPDRDERDEEEDERLSRL